MSRNKHRTIYQPLQIVPSQYLHQVCLHAITNLTHLEQTGIDQPLDIIHGIDKDSASPDLTHIHIATEVTAMKVSTDITHSPPIDILTGAHHAITNPVQGTTTMICHIEDHSLHTKSTSTLSRDQSHFRHMTSHRPIKVSSHSQRTPKCHKFKMQKSYY